MELFPLNVEDLINGRSVESVRIEYKSSLQEVNKWSVVKTIAGFANDLQNLNGGLLSLALKQLMVFQNFHQLGWLMLILKLYNNQYEFAVKESIPNFNQ